jgi:hypothetical protein
MSADYVVIDSTGALVSQSFPYSKLFATSNAFFFAPPPGLAYLILTFRTGYTDPTDAAVVTINGTIIAEIYPSPFTSNIYDVETAFFVFDNALLQSPIQILQIIPQGNLNDLNNYVIVGDVICHYRSSI